MNTHLWFADDLLVFTDGKLSSIEEILKVFTEFAAYSGFQISLEKSTLFMAGIEEDDKVNILEHFPFGTGTLPVRYLGLPLLSKRMSIADYTPLLERIRKRITSWTARSLSFAGRLQLIGSVIHSITSFWMSAFMLPKQCIAEIDKMCSSFLWSGPSLDHNKAKIAWKDVCKPTEEGGLGLRSLAEANLVSCLKMIWRLLSAKTSRWVRWIHKYLIRKSSFWKVDEKSSLGSWTWKKLLKYRPIAAELTKVETESGADTSFWFDVWCPLGKLSGLVGASGCISLGVRQDSTVEKAVQTYIQRRHRTEVLVQVEREILKLRERGLSNHLDSRLWKSKGDTYETSFSTKNTWNLVRNASPRCEWHKGVWFPFATPKYTFITWLTVHNRLSTGDRMIKWNQQANAACGLCDALMESRNHLFFYCVYSKEVWKRLTLNMLETSYSSDWDAILRLLVDIRQEKIQLFLLRYTFQLTVYSVWRERNARRHGDKPQTVENMCCYIDKGVRNKISTISKLGGKGYEEAMVRWFASR